MVWRARVGGGRGVVGEGYGQEGLGVRRGSRMWIEKSIVCLENNRNNRLGCLFCS